jgi:hypothetical protein
MVGLAYFRLQIYSKSAKNKIIKHQQVHPAGAVDVHRLATEKIKSMCSSFWMPKCFSAYVHLNSVNIVLGQKGKTLRRYIYSKCF